MDEGLAKIRHDRSTKDFPGLNLHEDEYVEFAFKRARICLAMIWGAVAAGLIVILLAFILVLMGQPMLDDMGKNFLYIILFAMFAAAILAGVISMMIYKGNRLYITNQRAIQTVMTAPMARSMNVIDLSSIEDVSFSENGILQQMLHFGTLRLSTVGDETTYTFPYSDIRPDELKAVSKLVSDAKKRGKKKVEATTDASENA